MTQIDYGRAAGYFLLKDVFNGFKLGFKYFFAPKATLNYPHEKGPLSPRFRVSTRCGAIPMAKSGALPASCARRSAPRRRSPSTPSRATTVAAARRAMTST